MKVEFKDKEQSVTVEKNYDYTTWNVGDVVHRENYPNAAYKFVGIINNLQFFYNDLHPSPHSFILNLPPAQKEYFTLVESKQKPKQDVVLTLEHDWEVALVTSLLGMLDVRTIDYLTNRDTPVHRLFEQFNNLSDYCANNDIHVNTDCYIRRQ